MGRMTSQIGNAFVAPIISPLRLSEAWRRRAFGEAVLAMSPGKRGDIFRPLRKPPCRNRARIRASLASAAAAGLLAGCATVNPVPTTVETAGMPNPEAALLQSIQHVDSEMAQLGQMSPSMTQVVQPAVPEDLRRTVSFTWKGPLDAGVAKLAQSIGYVFYTIGPVEQQALDVAIEISSVPVFQVFQALGAQAGTQATVQVDPQHHQVQVIHHV